MIEKYEMARNVDMNYSRSLKKGPKLCCVKPADRLPRTLTFSLFITCYRIDNLVRECPRGETVAEKSKLSLSLSGDSERS